MSIGSFVPEVIFMDNIESNIKLLTENENSNNQIECISKENFLNLNSQFKQSSDSLSFDMKIRTENINLNSIQEPSKVDHYYKIQPLQGIEQNIGENIQIPVEDEVQSYTSYSNFKLEWDHENKALFVVIPSVDSLDHWMMLFLQPLGITCDSLSLNNCCLKRNCDFRIRLDDERLLLYPDLLKDISDFLSTQYLNWQYYRENVIMRDFEVMDSEQEEYIGDNLINGNNIGPKCHNYWKFPDINVFVNNDSHLNNEINFAEDENSSKFYEKENFSQNNGSFERNIQKSITNYNTDIYGKCLLVPELCSKGDEPLVQNNTLSCLTTNISDLNVLTTDSGVLQVLTSENSNHDDNYFALNTNSSMGTNDKEYFPIEA
ncbi:unnamed protein product [Cryptosporidium hominis]|uniref:Uncharacterized protein n=1 Tax=Cryptosporidium hominis TaxID=237895 RepID=A0A0S4TDY1_CRYHO|nr:hypothetical protein ChTU502y2012_401g0050 [Cryptosporidium hominis]PPA65136.1 hypothetical protein ChUKH1_15630 [Cryptosporidium hominis]PPS93687.1 Uncharacterized protein GY17_00002556 [Cryptosporidium hominis]CUV05270.1 unnamed protein product [Cryptosporidium hominis]|eukprot:PPS93687.1 Uncharacterized protein GY17_00002556 [Cryptosporidium hominis]